MRRYSIRDGPGTEIFLIHVLKARGEQSSEEDEESSDGEETPKVSSTTPASAPRKLSILEPPLEPLMLKSMEVYPSLIFPPFYK